MLEDVVYLSTSFYVVVGRSYYVLAFQCSLSSTRGHIFETSVTRLVIEVTRLVLIMILTILVIVMFCF
jgi:hypothetical protein